MKNRLYENVQNDIKNKIENNVFPAGMKLDSEDALCEKYGVSKVTLRKALENLINDNYIESKPRIGYFVKNAQTDFFNSLYDIHNCTDEPITESEVLYAGELRRNTAKPDVSNNMEIVRRFSGKSEYLAVEFVQLLFSHSHSERTEKNEKYYDELSTKMISVASSKKLTLECVEAEEAIAEMLYCFIGDPLMKLTEEYFDVYGKRYASSVLYINGEKATFVAEKK